MTTTSDWQVGDNVLTINRMMYEIKKILENGDVIFGPAHPSLDKNYLAGFTMKKAHKHTFTNIDAGRREQDAKWREHNAKTN